VQSIGASHPAVSIKTEPGAVGSADRKVAEVEEAALEPQLQRSHPPSVQPPALPWVLPHWQQQQQQQAQSLSFCSAGALASAQQLARSQCSPLPSEEPQQPKVDSDGSPPEQPVQMTQTELTLARGSLLEQQAAAIAIVDEADDIFMATYGQHRGQITSAEGEEEEEEEASETRALQLRHKHLRTRRQALKVTGESLYRGVSRQNHGRLWHAQIGHGGDKLHLGTFDDEVDAARAYDNRARELHGLRARLNFPQEVPVDNSASQHLSMQQSPMPREHQRQAPLAQPKQVRARAADEADDEPASAPVREACKRGRGAAIPPNEGKRPRESVAERTSRSNPSAEQARSTSLGRQQQSAIDNGATMAAAAASTISRGTDITRDSDQLSAALATSDGEASFDDVETLDVMSAWIDSAEAEAEAEARGQAPEGMGRQTKLVGGGGVRGGPQSESSQSNGDSGSGPDEIRVPWDGWLCRLCGRQHNMKSTCAACGASFGLGTRRRRPPRRQQHASSTGSQRQSPPQFGRLVAWGPKQQRPRRKNKRPADKAFAPGSRSAAAVAQPPPRRRKPVGARWAAQSPEVSGGPCHAMPGLLIDSVRRDEPPH
jgi:ribosomal protein L37E